MYDNKFISVTSHAVYPLSPVTNCHIFSDPLPSLERDVLYGRPLGLQKVRLSPIQSVLNATARLIARLPRTSHISACMFDHLHWLTLIARIQLKVPTLMYRSHIGQALRYLRDVIRMPSSAISLRPLRSFDRHDLFVPRAKTLVKDSEEDNCEAVSIGLAILIS